ncbi:unnamed protein product [Penicillium camemberti]|uniref:Str. FM013 n=1 Tax=Penicillium camemberti (strain FM 013) TaxID=1429867 RepID=A0A0G4P3Z6_PENC3|nr:unnamed protein product [Penicillium camemberti]
MTTPYIDLRVNTSHSEINTSANSCIQLGPRSTLTRPHGYLVDVSSYSSSFVTGILFFQNGICIQFDLMYLRV